MIDTINRRPTKTELHLTLDDLNFLIDTYLEDRGQRTKVYTTAIQYDKLSFFLRFWATHGPTVKWRLTVDTFPAFNLWLDQHISAATGRGLAWNTRNDAFRRLRQCLKWCCNNGYISENFRLLFEQMPVVTGAPPIKMAPDLTVWESIWDAISDSPLAVRDAAIFAILAGTGMRRAECANLQIDDVKFLDDNSGFITVRDSKTGRGRFAAFDDVTGQEIRCYLNLWRVKQGPLFFHAGREPLQPLEPGTIHRIIRRAAVRGGVENKYQGCHDIRRAYATFWMRKLPGEGYSWLLARELGHTVTSGMTSYYAKLDHEDIRQCLQTQRCSLFTQLMSQIQRNDSAAQRRRL